VSASPPIGAGGSVKVSHNIVAISAFELIGVALLAILADTNKTVGNIVVLFMFSFLFIWFMLFGSKFLSNVLRNVNNLTGQKG
jgi:hypothetical protein